MLVARDRDNPLAELHHYVAFCWLAWGPSIPTTSLTEDGSKFMVVQAAFGDEANSLPLIMRASKWGLIKAALGEGHESGCPVRLRNALVVKPKDDDFFAALRDHPLFKEMFSETNAAPIALYLPHGDGRHADGDVELITGEHDPFYSTAYVWMMLEQVAMDERHSGVPPTRAMTPGGVVPFFEHANLASADGLDFFQHCLARKAIHHVIGCERDPKLRERGYYRFATALFPGKMVEILLEEIAGLNDRNRAIVEDRLNIPTSPAGWRTPVEVLDFAERVANEIGTCCMTVVSASGDCEGCEKPCARHGVPGAIDGAAIGSAATAETDETAATSLLHTEAPSRRS
jgi:hypothetical protein